MSLFQSNLRKQIRNLPKILNFVKIIHYFSKLFTGVLSGHAEGFKQVVQRLGRSARPRWTIDSLSSGGRATLEFLRYYVHDLLLTVSFSTSCWLLPKEGNQVRKRKENQQRKRKHFSTGDSTFHIVMTPQMIQYSYVILRDAIGASLLFSFVFRVFHFLSCFSSFSSRHLVFALK